MGDSKNVIMFFNLRFRCGVSCVFFWFCFFVKMYMFILLLEVLVEVIKKNNFMNDIYIGSKVFIYYIV